MEDPIGALAEAIRERRAVLFVGAGVSMSVGLPSWQKLIEHMTAELGIDPRLIDRPGDSYQTLAEYYLIKHGSIGTLRSWMDRNWNVSRERVRQSRLHRLIVDLGFPVIYTTNYDRNLEVAFEVHGRPYVKIATARDFAQAEPGLTQIVKYHGDFDEESSLVLTETDYFDRLSFEAPIDVKFRNDAFGRTMLFIGYSLSDTNIRLLLHRLWQAWRRSGHEADRPPSFVFAHRPNPVEQAILARWGITMLVLENESPEGALCAFLERLAVAVKPRRAAKKRKSARPKR